MLPFEGGKAWSCCLTGGKEGLGGTPVTKVTPLLPSQPSLAYLPGQQGSPRAEKVPLPQILARALSPTISKAPKGKRSAPSTHLSPPENGHRLAEDLTPFSYPVDEQTEAQRSVLPWATQLLWSNPNLSPTRTLG